MPGSASESAAASFGDQVEVVRGDRVRPRAVYRRRAFRLMSVDSMRHRWRCSVTTCPSRLMTDKFGEKHVLFSFKDHDEDEHRATEERRRSQKTYRSEALVKIGEFMYVLERSVGEIKCWRCRYVSCPGRCRTSLDHNTLLHGPTTHTCHSIIQQEQQSRQTHHEPPQSPPKGVAGTSTGNEDNGEPACSPHVFLPGLLSPHRQATATAANMSPAKADGDSRRLLETCSRSPDAARAVPGQSSQGTPVKIELSDDDVDLEEDETSMISDDEDEGRQQRLCSRGGRRSNLSGLAAEALETTSGSRARVESRLRAEIYQRICHLLLKEEELVEIQIRNETRKGKLIGRQMKKGI